MIRLGVCAPPEMARSVADAGYDYIECAFSAIAAMSAAVYEDALSAILDSPIRAEAFNVMLPATVKVVGPDAKAADIRAYLDSALPRVAAMGCEIIVFGSGGARAVPAGYAASDAYDDIIAFLRMAGDRCARYGVTIAVEPLNSGECNILNSVTEAIWIVQRVNHRAVKVLADSYHMSKERQSPHDIRAAGDLMAHTHISRPDRGYPYPGDGHEAEYAQFFRALRDIGYNGRMSAEATAGDFGSDIVNAYKTLDPLRRRG